MFKRNYIQIFYLLLLLIAIPKIISSQVTFDKKLIEKKLQPTCVAYSHDSKLIASGGINNDIVVWNSNDNGDKKYLKGLSGFPISLAFTLDNKNIISGGKDEKVTLWSVENQKIVYSVKNHKGTVRGIAISPDGKTFASCSDDKTIKLCQISDGSVIKVLSGHSEEVQSVNFSPDGLKLVSASFDKTVREWNVQTGEQIAILQGHADKVRFAIYSPSGKQIGSCGDDKTIKIWENKELVNSIMVHKAIVQTLAYSPDGKFIASGAHDKLVAIINVEKGKIVYLSSKMDNYILSVAFSPDGLHLASASLYSDEINIWNVDGLKNIEDLAVNEIKQSPGPAEKPKAEVKAELKVEPKKEPVKVEEKKEPPKIVKTEEVIKPQVKNEIPVTEKQPEPKIEVPKVEIPKPANEKIENNSPIGNEIDISAIKPTKTNDYRFALIIGNEDYSSYQAGLSSEVNVEFAENDARAFKDYALKILGVPEENIDMKINARAIEMKRALKKINALSEVTNGKAELYFYYAGHGLPDENTKKPYLIPVDVSGTEIEYGVPLNEIYASLTQFPTKRVTVFLDACFSGGARNEGLVQARGVKVRAKEDALNGNIVVFTSSSGDQSSLPYKEKKHGLFTYFLLKKLNETKGEISYNDLSEYLKEQVGIKAVTVNNKKQTPQTNFGSSAGPDSKNWTFR